MKNEDEETNYRLLWLPEKTMTLLALIWDSAHILKSKMSYCEDSSGIVAELIEREYNRIRTISPWKIEETKEGRNDKNE